MFATAAAAILVAIGLALIRAFRGPTLYDRFLAVNMVGTQIVLMVAVLGFFAERPEFLDIALVYALISFVSTIAVLKFCCRRHEAPNCGCDTGNGE
ncbi:MAG: cation:proton antiporter [Gammaproteobacteria bacterium]|jgi:multicomponent Na+:H+ antiporter subunit F